MNSYHNPDSATIQQIVKRPQMDTTTLAAVIDDVFQNIETRKDEALMDYTERFDKIRLDALRATSAELKGAEHALPMALKAAIQQAHHNITVFHEKQRTESIKVQTQPGVMCWQQAVPIDRVGLYIPGGSAPLFSTVLMLAIPAKLAGCSEIVLCSPPNMHGQIHPAILYTAQLCGVTTVIKAGGAQAIAAMSMGTESVPKVDKLFGPGNQYVTAAKQKAFEKGTAIDMPAGPSEVLVFADETGDPAFIASDLLAQAEHGVDSQVILATTKVDLINQVLEQINQQEAQLPRQEITSIALDHSHAVSFDDVDTAFAFINEYAPEHLIISADDPDPYIPMIHNAGSVFLGHYTPESAGDYASGTNHTLPTNGHAKAFSGVNLDAFLKKITFQQISDTGLDNLGPTIIQMAEAEQLQAHANAVKIRLDRS